MSKPNWDESPRRAGPRVHPDPRTEPPAPVKGPPISEKDFLRSVVDYAARRSWLYVHFLPAQHRDSWRTPFQGPLGKGHADLLLTRGKRLIYAELKRDAAAKRATPPEQHAFLSAVGEAGAETYIWEPGDWDTLEGVLR